VAVGGWRWNRAEMAVILVLVLWHGGGWVAGYGSFCVFFFFFLCGWVAMNRFVLWCFVAVARGVAVVWWQLGVVAGTALKWRSFWC
jgi:hypothetical protein